MKKGALQLIDFFLNGFGVFLLWILITGGTTFQWEGGKLEASSLGPWVMAWSAFLYLRLKLSSSPYSGYQFLQRIVSRLLDPSSSQKAFWIFLILFCGSLFVAHYLRNLSLHTHAYDQFCLHQALFWAWSTPPLKCDFCIAGTQLGEHTAFTLFLLSPLTVWFHSNAWIYLLQVFVVFTPIVVAIRKGPTASLSQFGFLLLFIFACSKALQNSVIWDFREDALAFAFMLLGCISLWKGKVAYYFTCLILAALSKENMPLVTLFFAGPILLDPDLPFQKRQRKWMAFATVVISLVLTVVIFKWVIPFIQGDLQKANNIVSRFPGMGNTPLEVLLTITTSPSAWWQLLNTYLLSPGTLKYLVLLLGPFIYFLRHKAVWLIPAFPGLMMNLLSGHPQQRSLTFHYDLPILPFLIMGTLAGVAKLHRDQKISVQQWTVALLIALSFSVRWPGHKIQTYWPTPTQTEATRFLNQLSPLKVTGASSHLMAQLAHIKEVRLVRFPEAPPLDSATSWKEWSEKNQGDLTHLPGHNALHAEQFVLHLKNPWERFLKNELQRRGWEIMASTSNQEVILLGHPEGQTLADLE